MTLTLFCAFQPALIFWCTVPRYSLAHRRFSHSLFKAWKKKKTLPVWQRLHHCLNHLKTLMKMLGLRAGFFFVFFFFFLRLGGNTYLHFFTETMWMLSVGLTTGVDSWADALKVNCERLWQGTKKAVQQPLLHCTMGKILSSQEEPVSPSSGHLYRWKRLRIHFIVERKDPIWLCWKRNVVFCTYCVKIWTLCQWPQII